MTILHHCPKCGKVMQEAPKFPGYWQCPDYITPTNSSPPFKFVCTGSKLTPEAGEALEAEMTKLANARN